MALASLIQKTEKVLAGESVAAPVSLLLFLPEGPIFPLLFCLAFSKSEPTDGIFRRAGPQLVTSGPTAGNESGPTAGE